MGWVWKNDGDDSDYINSSSSSSSSAVVDNDGSSNPNGDGDGGSCATRRIVTSQCHTEEVEPGKFIRKCEKTEQIFKDCFGRPTDMVQSNKEYTEEDVTDQMVKGSYPFGTADSGPSYFPGLRSDIEAIERGFFGGISKFFEAAEEMRNELFNSMGFPHTYNNPPPSHEKRGIDIGGGPPREAFPKSNADGDIDLSGLAKDV